MLGKLVRDFWSPDDKSMIPREKLFWEGRESLSDQELLTIFLSTGLLGLSVLQVATRLLVQFDGLRGLMQVDGEEILRQPGVGVAKYAQLTGALEIAKRYLRTGLERGETISDPSLTRQFLLLKMRHHVRGVFAVMSLDNQHGLISFEDVF